MGGGLGGLGFAECKVIFMSNPTSVEAEVVLCCIFVGVLSIGRIFMGICLSEKCIELLLHLS